MIILSLNRNNFGPRWLPFRKLNSASIQLDFDGTLTHLLGLCKDADANAKYFKSLYNNPFQWSCITFRYTYYEFLY
jgi:hypothetical protein